MLVRTPPVYATTCNYSSSTPTYLYATLYDEDTSTAYGVGSYSDPSTWTIPDAALTGHVALWVNLLYESNAWVQAGYDKGTTDGYNPSDRVPYTEINVYGSYWAAVWTSDAIIDGDSGDIEAWTYSQSGNVFTAHGLTYSSNLNTAFVGSATTGSLSVGVPTIGLEVAYVSYSGTCDSVSEYTTTSGEVYTTSTSTSEPLSVGTSWATCTTWSENSPYWYSESSCHGTIDYSGS